MGRCWVRRTRGFSHWWQYRWIRRCGWTRTDRSGCCRRWGLGNNRKSRRIGYGRRCLGRSRWTGSCFRYGRKGWWRRITGTRRPCSRRGRFIRLVGLGHNGSRRQRWPLRSGCCRWRRCWRLSCRWSVRRTCNRCRWVRNFRFRCGSRRFTNDRNCWRIGNGWRSLGWCWVRRTRGFGERRNAGRIGRCGWTRTYRSGCCRRRGLGNNRKSRRFGDGWRSLGR